MRRYVFLNSDAHDEKVMKTASKVTRSRGATMVNTLAGTMLLELAPEQMPEIAGAFPGWRYSVERKTTRVPESKPLERSQARDALAAPANG